MKKLIIAFICIVSYAYAFSQISLVRSDFFDVNDSIPQVYYGFENSNLSIASEQVMPENLTFGSLSAFPLIMIDTLVYFPSSDTDPNGTFEDATCAFITKDGFVMHLKIDNDKINLVGLQNQLPFTNDLMSLKFVDTLSLYNFPCNFESENLDQGVALERRHISEFQSQIPAEYYNMVAAMYDTVRFIAEIKLSSIFDEHGSIIFTGDTLINGNFPYLRENSKMTSIMDVQLRSKFGGSYTSLSNIPGIGSQLPMELPIKDTSYVHRYWTKDLKQQILEIKYNTDYSQIFSMTFRFSYLSFVNSNFQENLKVFPNPSADFINFSLDNPNNYKLYIFSAQGHLMNIVDMQTNNTSVDLNNYKTGVYFYQIFNKTNSPIAGGKFIKK